MNAHPATPKIFVARRAFAEVLERWLRRAFGFDMKVIYRTRSLILLNPEAVE